MTLPTDPDFRAEAVLYTIYREKNLGITAEETLDLLHVLGLTELDLCKILSTIATRFNWKRV